MTQKREHSEKESGEALAAGAPGGMKTGRSGDFGGPLYRKLREYSDSDYYGFHMPGHKRILGGFENPYRFDITEIDGFDDLHHPETDGILTKAQERAAELYGAEETHFLVGGSTAGILSAISGCTCRGGRILMARNCHRSVYHAAELRDLTAEYLYPQQISSLGINGAICPEDVDKAMKADGQIQAVIITSPTYDGICSDVRAIAESCHRYGVPLIVDQAHGAHFPFSGYFPEDALIAGADVVIHSVHKTLPALTQTALLHIQGRLADRERIRRFLSIYQSSSPSYLLMASIDACVDLLDRRGKELFGEHIRLLSAFREGCRDLKSLYLAGDDLAGNNIAEEAEERPETGRGKKTAAAWDFDRSKLLISTRKAGITGSRLSELLLERYHLQMEMSAPDYVVGIASAADTEEGFDRLSRALHDLDREFQESTEEKGQKGRAGNPDPDCRTAEAAGLPRLPFGMTAARAAEQEKERCALSSAAGRTAAGYVYLYPPGIPLIVPGEVVTEEAAARMEGWLEEGFTVHGLEDGNQLQVIKL